MLPNWKATGLRGLRAIAGLQLVRVVAAAFIKRAKDRQLVPSILEARLSELPDASLFQLARMGVEIYADYQRSLAYRGGVDFDDLIRLALEALTLDPDYLARLRRRWPYVLEDEAQDSTELQESILRLLVGEQWQLGTGRRSQPGHLSSHLPTPIRGSCELPAESWGWKGPSYLSLAAPNWRSSTWPTTWSIGLGASIRPKPCKRRFFLSTSNPQLQATRSPILRWNLRVYSLSTVNFTPGQELQAVVDSLARWLPDHSDRTVAVLAPRNRRGFELVDLLKQRQDRLY